MKKSIYLIAAGLCLAFGLISCTALDDVKKHGASSAAEFYGTDGESLEGLANVYRYIETSGFGSFLPIMNALSDDFYTGGGQRGNDVNLEELNELRFTSDNSSIRTLYTNFYNLIYRCNVLTTNIKGETPVQRRVVAEAKVIRAHAYTRLVSLWGRVPLITEEIKDGNYARPLSDEEDIYKQIEKDLTEAINSGALLEKPDLNTPVVNVTKQTAQAMLGKAYVFWSTFLNGNKWAEARTALEAVISSGKYDLVPIENYSDQFHLDMHFSKESLFETNRMIDPNNMANNGNVHRLGWRAERFKVAQFEAVRASGVIPFQPVQYGFYYPSVELAQAFEEMEGPDGARYNQSIKTYAYLNSLPLQVADGQQIYGCAGYFQYKLMPRDNEYMSTHKTAQNYLIMRFAEVLLLAAEAQLPANGGSQTKVDEYVNRIKSRAGITDRPGNYTLDDIMKEKRLELCYESTRYVDLVRWGKIAEVYGSTKGTRYPTLYGLADGSDNGNEQHTPATGLYNVEWKSSNGNGFQPKFGRLPIPLGEINVNSEISEADQNPLWL